MTFRIVGRADWGYRQRRGISSAPRNRAGLVVHYGFTPEYTGMTAPRRLQDIAFGRGFAAISYTLVVTQAGEIYSARPLALQGAHTAGFNRTRHGVCAPGGPRSKPTDAWIDAVAWLFRHGRERGWWADRLERHSDLVATHCPDPFGAVLPEIRRRADRRVTPKPEPERTWLEMTSKAEVIDLIDQRIARAFDLGKASDGAHLTETHRDVVSLLEAADLGRIRDLQYPVAAFRSARDLGLLDHLDTLAAIVREHNDVDAEGDY